MAALLAAMIRPCRSCASFLRLQQLYGNGPFAFGGHLQLSGWSEMPIRHASTIGVALVHCDNCLPVHAVATAHCLITKLCSQPVFSHKSALLCHRSLHTHSEPVIKNENRSNEKDDVSLDQTINISRQSCLSDCDENKIDNKQVTARKSKRKPVSDYNWIKPEGLDTGIKVYNSLTKKKEPLILPAGRLATWYYARFYNCSKS
jgi:hypothetical protein